MIPLPNRSFRSVIGRVWLPFSVASLAGAAYAQTKQPSPPATPPPAPTAAPAPAAASANQVLTYTFTVTSNGLNAEGKANDFEEIATEQLSGDDARVTYFEPTNVDAPTDGPQQVGSKPMFYGRGSYYLVKRGAPEITIVAPSKKKYFEMMGDAAADQAVGKLLHIDLSDVAIAVQRVQPDTSIQEMQAHHWRITESYTQKVRVLLLSSTQKVQKVTEYYFVPELKDDVNPFIHVGGIFMQADDYRTKMQAAVAQLDPGIPLLSVSRATTTDSRGAGNSILVTSITNVSREPAAPDLFVIPAGYEKSSKEVIPAERAGLPANTTPAISTGQIATPPSGNQSTISGAAKQAIGKPQQP